VGDDEFRSNAADLLERFTTSTALLHSPVVLAQYERMVILVQFAVNFRIVTYMVHSLLRCEMMTEDEKRSDIVLALGSR